MKNQISLDWSRCHVLSPHVEILVNVDTFIYWEWSPSWVETIPVMFCFHINIFFFLFTCENNQLTCETDLKCEKRQTSRLTFWLRFAKNPSPQCCHIIQWKTFLATVIRLAVNWWMMLSRLHIGSDAASALLLHALWQLQHVVFFSWEGILKNIKAALRATNLQKQPTRSDRKIICTTVMSQR